MRSVLRLPFVVEWSNKFQLSTYYATNSENAGRECPECANLFESQRQLKLGFFRRISDIAKVAPSKPHLALNHEPLKCLEVREVEIDDPILNKEAD